MTDTDITASYYITGKSGNFNLRADSKHYKLTESGNTLNILLLDNLLFLTFLNLACAWEHHLFYRRCPVHAGSACWPEEAAISNYCTAAGCIHPGMERNSSTTSRHSCSPCTDRCPLASHPDRAAPRIKHFPCTHIIVLVYKRLFL